jgi:hypothetical protein
LEVAEHIPAESADDFIKTLTSLAPAVLFSAAVPGQGGVGHRNEQWQSYWATLFYNHGYLPLDFVREEIWGNRSVSWWYAQNILLYVKKDLLATCPFKHRLYGPEKFTSLDRIHPENYNNALKRGTGYYVVRRLIKKFFN